MGLGEVAAGSAPPAACGTHRSRLILRREVQQSCSGMRFLCVCVAILLFYFV